MYLLGFGKLDVGLEQPIANWAKRGGSFVRSLEEGSPGYSELIARYARTGELPTYIELPTPRG